MNRGASTTGGCGLATGDMRDAVRSFAPGFRPGAGVTMGSERASNGIEGTVRSGSASHGGTRVIGAVTGVGVGTGIGTGIGVGVGV
ncbi:MAG: hypothetical protein ACRYHA_30485, partial [Janthinobacterium lividum]